MRDAKEVAHEAAQWMGDDTGRPPENIVYHVIRADRLAMLKEVRTKMLANMEGAVEDDGTNYYDRGYNDAVKKCHVAITSALDAMREEAK